MSRIPNLRRHGRRPLAACVLPACTLAAVVAASGVIGTAQGSAQGLALGAALGVTPGLGYRASAPPAPDPPTNPFLRNVRRPMMSGVAAVGGRLTTSTGAWSAPIVSITIRWERCTRTGLRCRVVARRLTTYRVVAADLGHAIRVVVQALSEDGLVVEAASHLLAVKR